MVECYTVKYNISLNAMKNKIKQIQVYIVPLKV